MSVHATIEPLEWESDFFTLTSGKLNFDPAAAPLTLSALDAFQVVQAKVAADSLALADALAVLGFRLVEGEIDCCLRVPKRDGGGDAQDVINGATTGAARNRAQSGRSGALRMAGRDDMAAVGLLASAAFRLSRFREPWYRGADCRRFYAVWAQNAILGAFDDLCLVKGRPGAVEGMVTLRRLGTDEARIGLLAVDPALTGRGIGRILCAGALAWCRLQRISRLRVATQAGNIAALRLYIACGANVDSTAYWLYR
ncbi:dTDP-4-amino-4,6-dideoxy-D-galactose acyltransferase [Sodalis sp. RH24]|uniref:dTDP-4-amino-4,6-dideoxy-D-galactose acyltransferase n=1 Tax=unclassified Sodalis (in: enterobacteria) TaxID=2636512 RepID=UPI0039B66785